MFIHAFLGGFENGIFDIADRNYPGILLSEEIAHYAAALWPDTDAADSYLLTGAQCR
jgi:hypothetical protein